MILRFKSHSGSQIAEGSGFLFVYALEPYRYDREITTASRFKLLTIGSGNIIVTVPVVNIEVPRLL